jgi:hypothetical protein
VTAARVATTQRGPDVVAAVLILAATLALFAPALFGPRAILIGDSPFHGIPMLHYLREVLYGHYSMLWTDLVYAGHPVFAESQGGFLNPLNLLVAALFEPVTGVDVYHFLCTFLCALGVHLLCRELGCRASSSLFGATAMAASTMWLTLQGNLTISNVTMCVPWVMLAFERLLRQPDVTAGLWLALAMSYLVLAGYPHVVQGMAVFLFVSLVSRAAGWARKRELAARLRSLVAPGVVAVVFTLGLCAAQLLPMFELASESYRAAGVDYVRFAPQTFLRGLLFADIVPEELTPNFTLLGSMAVSMLFLSGALVARGARALGMLLATLFLCYLGFGAQAPGFEFIHRHGLVPGMRYFRLMTPYFYIGVVGVCVVAALGVEAWADARANARRRLALIACSAVPVLAGAVVLHTAQVHWWHYASLALCVLCGGAAIATGREALLPVALLAVLAVEVCVLRAGAIYFAPADLMARPGVLERTCFARAGCTATTADLSINTVAVSFAHARSREAPLGLPRAVASFSPMTNMLWDVRAIGGAMALQLERSKLATDLVREEMLQGSARAPGARITDILGVRYLTLGGFAPAADAALRGSEALAPLSENPAARGRFQYYRDAVFVDSAAAALARFRRAEPCASLPIVIEGMPPPQDTGPSCVEVPAQHDFRIESRSATAADMRLEVHTDAPGWLFVADSWYPGWRARVNGEDRTVYPAQLAGKAVRLDAGLNRVRLRYAPLSFRIGAYISLATVLAFALIALRARLRRGNVQEATA